MEFEAWSSVVKLKMEINFARVDIIKATTTTKVVLNCKKKKNNSSIKQMCMCIYQFVSGTDSSFSIFKSILFVYTLPICMEIFGNITLLAQHTV